MLSGRKCSLVMVFAALAAASGCGSSVRTFTFDEEVNAGRNLAALQQLAESLPNSEYRIGPGDVLEVKVFGVDGLEVSVRVPESGTFTFPLIGEVTAWNHTASEVEKAIADALREQYINDPHVTVFIEEFNSYRISVVGEVKRPGTVVLKKGGVTLIDALAEAGGLSENAATTVYVTSRDDAGKSIARTVSLNRILKEGALDENVPLRPGDSVYVPEGGYVFVTGYVNEPGAYRLRQDMTALQAVSTAGDFLDTSSRRVRIIRKIDSATTEVHHLDLAAVVEGKSPDTLLQKSDVIEAEASLWRVPVYGTLNFIKSVLGVGTSIR